MEAPKKPRVKEVNRSQYLLRPTDVEKLVDDEHPARAIWEFVCRLDLSAFYASIEAVEGEPGRSAWDPRVMVAIWVYAYSRGIGSAREIERRCEYDPAFQWLTGMEVINHHSLSDFRITEKERLDELFRQVLGLLSADGLIEMERVMHDGTKIRARASGKTFRREQRIREFLKLAEEQINAVEEPQEDGFSEREAKARERASRERKEKLELALKELEKVRQAKTGKEKEQARVSVTDPEARNMKQSDGGYAPSYNAQISTDSKHGIVIAAGISQSNPDWPEMMPALDRIESNLGKLPKQFVVDGGYSSHENVTAAAEKSVELFAPIVDASTGGSNAAKAHGIAEGFTIDKFEYDSQSDSYRCPAGKELKLYGKTEMKGRPRRLYRAKHSDCLSCSFKPSCCPKSFTCGRSLQTISESAHATAFKKKMETDWAKAIYKLRAPIAEFSNAWLKAKIGLRQFSVTSANKAHMELTWACMTMNIQHWSRLRWQTA